MRIRAGYTIGFDCPAPTPMLLTLSLHPSRVPDLIEGGEIAFTGSSAPHTYADNYGNTVTRIVAEPGGTVMTTSFLIEDSGQPDEVALDARQVPVEQLPDDAIVYLLGSRYCDTDRLSDTAWGLFGQVAPGWPRVQAICDFVHDHISFGYQNARSTRSAWDAYQERIGVCRDFAHLAVTFCRCMNIPARYCTGYLGDIGVPPADSPMDFSAWFDVYLDGRWFTFDARHNTPRIGRILIARGRDATDVAISNSFGSASLREFTVVTDEVVS